MLAILFKSGQFGNWLHHIDHRTEMVKPESMSENIAEG